MSDKTIVKDPAIRTLVKEYIASGKTENDLLVHCVANFHDFEKGKKTAAEYWKMRFIKASANERAKYNAAVEEGNLFDMECWELALAKVKFPTKRTKVSKSESAAIDADSQALYAEMAAQIKAKKEAAATPTTTESLDGGNACEAQISADLMAMCGTNA